MPTQARPEPPTQPILRHALVPFSLVIAFVLMYWARVPFPLTLLLISPIVVTFVMAPRWAQRSLEAFDRDALRLRSRNEHHALQARFDRALFMRFFAPPAAVHERRGQILRETGDPAGAARAYRAALLAAGDPAPLSVLLGLGHSAHAAGDDEQAIGAYRKVREIDETLPRVRLQLAHALLRRGRATDVDDAVALLGETPTAPPDRDEVALLRAYAELRRGKPAQAREILASSRGPAPLRDELRRAIDQSAAPKKARENGRSGRRSAGLTRRRA